MADILVIDDDPSILSVVTRLLETEGHTVRTADSVENALSMLSETRADLVITDVVMPEKGGIEALMEIHTRYPEIATILMSGQVPLDTGSISNLTNRYGARAVLTKPFARGELLAAVEKALDG